jgi:SAM-dependent methyltransferase
MKNALRDLLRSLGLLKAARHLRDQARILRAWPRNARARRAGTPDRLPLPPARLILRVSGEPDVGWFLEGGRRGAESLRASLTRNHVDLDRIESLLDFGCGCGRVARHWKDLRATVHGSDLNAAGIDWCRTHLPFGRFGTNSIAPPLPFGDGAFDFVYALSVFTHLPEELQSPWMREMHRVLRPEGHFLLTTHGASYRDDLTPDERERFEAGELVVKRSEEPGSNVCGAYHPERYVRERLGEGFTVVELVPEGAAGNPHQDLFLLRRDG